MTAQHFFSSACRWLGVPVCVGLAACQAPVDPSGHKIEKAGIVNGKYVNTLQPTAKDVNDVRQEANDMNKSTKDVQFTPAEQQQTK